VTATPEALEFIGNRIVESLSGTQWHDASLRIFLIDVKVARRSQRVRRTASGPEVDFRLVDPIGVVRQLQSHRTAMEGEGHPRWQGLFYRVTSDGSFEFEYLYEAPPPL
jgi:hypothetical protein